MNQWIVLLIIADIIVTLAVVVFIMKRRMTGGAMVLPEGSDITDLSQIGPLMNFAKERHDRIADYVRSNWSGIPDQLPGVLTSLVDKLEGEARAAGHTFSRELLKTLVSTTLRTKRVSKPDEVEIALAKVA